MNLRVGALILAAGNSSRMGRAKQLLPFDGEPLLERAVKTALQTRCAPVVVVTRDSGEEVEAVRRALANEPITWVMNASWQRGMGTSLRAGMAAIVPSDVDAVMLLVCDQPLVTAENLQQLLTAMLSSGKSMAAAGYTGTIGVPAVFRRQHFAELAAVADGAGAKGILQRQLDAVAIVPLSAAAMDVDDEPTYQSLLRRPAP